MTEKQVAVFYFGSLILSTTIWVYRWEIGARIAAAWQAFKTEPQNVRPTNKHWDK